MEVSEQLIVDTILAAPDFTVSSINRADTFRGYVHCKVSNNREGKGPWDLDHIRLLVILMTPSEDLDRTPDCTASGNRLTAGGR